MIALITKGSGNGGISGGGSSIRLLIERCGVSKQRGFDIDGFLTRRFSSIAYAVSLVVILQRRKNTTKKYFTNTNYALAK